MCQNSFQFFIFSQCFQSYSGLCEMGLANMTHEKNRVAESKFSLLNLLYCCEVADQPSNALFFEVIFSPFTNWQVKSKCNEQFHGTICIFDAALNHLLCRGLFIVGAMVARHHWFLRSNTGAPKHTGAPMFFWDLLMKGTHKIEILKRSLIKRRFFDW